MKLAIMQPYFMPYIGYWQLMNAVDTYVVYDDVNYINRGWINRNKILINGQEHLFTISLKNASQNKLIKEIEIFDDYSKLKKTIELAYKKAPCYEQASIILQRVLDNTDKNLANFLFISLQIICDYLGINCKLIKSSNIKKDESLHAEAKILNICNILNATQYINAIGGQELYCKKHFSLCGVKLNFLKSSIEPYRQFSGDFVPGLSIIDVMMFNSPEEIKLMLDKYELI